MPTLIRGHSYTLCIFLNGGFHYFLCATIVTEMDHFSAFGLHDTAHDIDSGIVPVKKCCGSDYADIIF